MTVAFLTDEHVPSVFITALRSSGYSVQTAKDAFGEATNDQSLLAYCASRDRVLITHDKKDFSSELSDRIDHPGIVIYTDPLFLRDDPDGAVRTLECALEYYSPTELAGERLWLNQWRR